MSVIHRFRKMIIYLSRFADASSKYICLQSVYCPYIPFQHILCVKLAHNTIHSHTQMHTTKHNNVHQTPKRKKNLVKKECGKGGKFLYLFSASGLCFCSSPWHTLFPILKLCIIGNEVKDDAVSPMPNIFFSARVRANTSFYLLLLFSFNEIFVKW